MLLYAKKTWGGGRGRRLLWLESKKAAPRCIFPAAHFSFQLICKKLVFFSFSPPLKAHLIIHLLPPLLLISTWFMPIAKPVDLSKMLKEVIASKSGYTTTPQKQDKLFNVAEIDTTGPALSTLAPLSPLPTKLQHLSLGQPQRAEPLFNHFPLSDTP